MTNQPAEEHTVESVENNKDTVPSTDTTNPPAATSTTTTSKRVGSNYQHIPIPFFNVPAAFPPCLLREEEESERVLDSDSSEAEDDETPEASGGKSGSVPLTVADVVEWVEALMQGASITKVFPSRSMLKSLCHTAIRVLQSEPNVLELHCEAGNAEDKWVIVGDIHGQYNDMLYHVLGQQQEGKPDRRFLFLGDYVDRGPQGLEVMVLLLCLKVVYPERVFILRGNHEDYTTSRTYGFYHECSSKFGPRVWKWFSHVFNHIPLAATIQCGARRIFCTHGGLSPNLSMVEAINFINRSDYGTEGLDRTATEIMDGLLWSDPSSETSTAYLANDRGCGYAFGESATAEFCLRNSLDFIVRAHQLAAEGYTWAHANKVLTLFSAPNYCGVSRNLGALMVMDGVSWPTPRFIQYNVAPAPTEPNSADPSNLPTGYFA